MKVVDGVVAGVLPAQRASTLFGYVGSPGVAVAAVASLIAAAINVNVTSWRSGMVASDMERLTVGWLAEMIGFPLGAAGMGLLTGGGSMANLSALAAARAVKGSGPVYATEETHFSVRKPRAFSPWGRCAWYR